MYNLTNIHYLMYNISRRDPGNATLGRWPGPAGLRWIPSLGGVNMDQTIVTLIGTLGFPIVMCLLLFRQNEKMTEAINKLEKAIVVLTERMGRVDESESSETKSD